MKVLILAGGKGSRLQSEKFNLPKALKELNGHPLLEYVLNNVSFIEKEDTYVVVGYKRDMIIDRFPEYNFAVQEEQLGTGHAAMMVEPYLKDCDDDIIILYGDMPMINRDILRAFVEYHKENNSKCTIMTAIFENQPPYGRIIRDKNDKFVKVVEEKDCTAQELKIKELNCGPYIVNSKLLFKALKQLKNNNAQGEYYLTDIPEIIKSMGSDVNIFINNSSKEMLGVNTIEDLKECESMIH